MRKITNKPDMYARWNKNLLGNKLRSWPDLASYLADGAPGIVNLRCQKIGPGRVPFVAGLTGATIEQGYETMRREGIRPEQVTIMEIPPDDRLTLQGEVYIGTGGLTLFAHENGPNVRMREAILLATQYEGLVARLLLEKHLWPSSLADLYVLLEMYDGAVVEFSSYEIPVGYVQGHNTLVWEVRNY
jgi:hypothetical protein